MSITISPLWLWICLFHDVTLPDFYLYFVMCLDTQSFSIVISSCILHAKSLFATLWTIAPQASLSMGFSRKEYSPGVGCHFLLQGVFPARDGTSVSYIPCLARRVLYLYHHLGSLFISSNYNNKLFLLWDVYLKVYFILYNLMKLYQLFSI